MVNAQQWLNDNFTKTDTEIILNNERSGLGATDEDKELVGELVIEDFANLTILKLERKDRAGGTTTIGGKVSKLTIKNCPKLKTIDLDKNEITEIIFEENFNDLEKLDVNNNKLTKLDVAKFSKLDSLDVHGNTSLSKDIRGIENMKVLKRFNSDIGFDGEYLREWRDALKNLLNIATDDLPDTWSANLTSRLGGKKLTDIPTGKTLKDLIDNFSSDKDILQQELNQAQAALSKKSDYDTIKAERDSLNQQLEAIKNELEVGSNATQQQIIGKIKNLKGRPTTSCTHTDYDSIKNERDSLKAEVESQKQKISELESSNPNKENLITKRVMVDTTNEWGLKLSSDQEKKISGAPTDKEAKTHWDKIVKEEVGKLKDENSSSTKLNIGLGALAIGSLLVLGWVLMKQQTNLPQTEPEEEKEKNKKV